MTAQGGQLDGGRLLVELSNQNPRLAQLLQNVIDSVNTVARNSSVSATGDVAAPKAPDAVTVSTAGEMMHIAINHTGQLQRGIRYFSEISTDAKFSQPMVIDHGSSRTSHPIPLPTKDSSGNTLSYYVRSYAQNPGGPPSAKTVVGGVGSPTAHTLSGTTEMTLQTSRGSGTAPNSGQSAGQGLGNFQQRTK